MTTERSSGSTGHASVNGLKMYYEIHGTGEPLILLHGGAGSTEMFNDFLPIFSKDRKIIEADRQAHGRTADPVLVSTVKSFLGRRD